MAERVAIVSVAQTKFQRCANKERVQDLVWSVVKQVLDETGLNFNEGMGIDNAITCSDDFYDARTISDGGITDYVGGHMRCEEKVSSDSLQAVQFAWAGILSGHYDITLVTAHAKESQAQSRNLITNAAFDPIYNRLLGIDYVQAAAFQARSYMMKTGAKRKDFAKVVVKSRKAAAKNPFAQETEKLTINDVLEAKMIADPLSELDIYPVSDGAVAMILATESKAKQITDNPVWILGGGCCYDGFYLGERDLTQCDALEKAAAKAYEMAGITRPVNQLQVAEISAYFSYQEPLWYEGLKFCPRGKGLDFLLGGATEVDGKLPVNPSGGVLAGNPMMVGGIARAAECYLQLTGKAGKHQVKESRKAIAHGTSGPAGLLQSVMIFGKD